VHLTDDIDLSTIDANGRAIGNAAFSFLAAHGAVVFADRVPFAAHILARRSDSGEHAGEKSILERLVQHRGRWLLERW
jgi:hypothetical protein